MKRYIGYIRNTLLTIVSYRESLFVSLLGTYIFYFVLYVLWKVIFKSNGTEIIKGMTFHQTFVYLTLATAVYRSLSSGIEWDMCFSMLNGDIIIHMGRPIDYQLIMMCQKAAYCLISFMFFVIPTYIIVAIFFRDVVTFGINTLFFLVCMFLTFIIMFTIEFFIGTITFYTESVWGLSTIKDILIAFMAGVSIPLQFFPEKLRAIAEILPFKSMYQDPIGILINSNISIIGILNIIKFQLMWVVIFVTFSRIIYRIMIKRIVINGG